MHTASSVQFCRNCIKFDSSCSVMFATVRLVREELAEWFERSACPEFKSLLSAPLSFHFCDLRTVHLSVRPRTSEEQQQFKDRSVRIKFSD